MLNFSFWYSFFFSFTEPEGLPEMLQREDGRHDLEGSELYTV